MSQKLLERQLEIQYIHAWVYYSETRVDSTKNNHFSDPSLNHSVHLWVYQWWLISSLCQLGNRMHSISSNGKLIFLSILTRRGQTKIIFCENEYRNFFRSQLWLTINFTAYVFLSYFVSIWKPTKKYGYFLFLLSFSVLYDSCIPQTFQYIFLIL